MEVGIKKAHFQSSDSLTVLFETTIKSSRSALDASVLR